MAIITDFNTNYTTRTDYGTRQTGNTTTTFGHASNGEQQNFQTSFAGDSVQLSAEAFEGAEASASSTIFNGLQGTYASHTEGQARIGRFLNGEVHSSGEIGGMNFESTARGSTREGAFAEFSSSVTRTEDSLSMSQSASVGAGARFDGGVDNNIGLSNGGSITANTSVTGYAGAFASGRTSLHADADSVVFSSGVDYAAGAGVGLRDTLGYHSENGTGMDLTVGVSSSAGTSGSANVILGREGDVTTFGVGLGGDLGVGGNLGFTVSLHDDDSAALTGNTLQGISNLAGDTTLGETTGTLGQFVTGDVNGLGDSPRVQGYAAGIEHFGSSVDSFTSGMADAGSSAQDFAREAEQGVLAGIGPNASNFEIASAGVQVAAARVVGWGGGLLESVGLVSNRAGGGRRGRR